MTPTVRYVQEKISEFNSLIFSSSLPPIPVVLSSARSFLGKVQYKRRSGMFGRNRGCDSFVMRISTAFDLPEREQEDVIIHEMIHYYIAYKGLRDTSAHGRLFRQMMSDINARFGRNITVSHKTSSASDSSSRMELIRPHYLCVSRFRDGSYGITDCARTRIFQIHRTLSASSDIASIQWFGSLDTFFNKFPRSNVPKVYRISEDELRSHLSDAQKMVCDGHSIWPV